VEQIIVDVRADVVAKEAFSCPVCGAICDASLDEARVALAVDSLDVVKERIVRDITIVCPEHGRQRVLLTAGRHSAEGQHVMVTAFPKPIRKHVRSLLPKIERAEFDATYAGTRLPSPGQFERWTDLAASFKPEPPRTP
jgi:glyoxylase-like metal-dependent hydrolase (beta-lactamase superfamily II)